MSLTTIVAILLLGAVLLIGASGAFSQRGGAGHDGAAARELVSEGALLLDVRTRGEFAAGHLEGAKNIPVQELAQRLSEVPSDRKVVVYCRSGNRTRTAARILEGAGYTVYDLGPMSAW